MVAKKGDDLLGLAQEREVELTRELEALEQEFEEKTRTLREELKRVRGAIRSLGGAAKRSGAGKEKAAKGGAGGFTTSEVSSLLEDRLKAAGKESEEELREFVYGEAERLGRPRQGLHRQFQRALEGERFERSGTAWRLKAEAGT